ncbi:MAG: ATP-binding cassette domain-containing protein [Bacteroides sp.]|nr:ATP-binding cassette domain-containing protein [Roseburia sp.]MCM1345934.1 ATP-binding cassette domain-containing protein [Bacteroides sp.]MCM1420298.1 ATP-binding cassette domain-containing protein [Bacteroides sp.]
MLRIRNLSLSYGVQPVFSGVTFDVRRGDIVCVCGESGCGKSSLLKSVLGFVDAEGSIEVGGIPLAESTVDEVRRCMAYLPQDLSLPYDTVEEMVRAPFDLRANRHIVFSEEQLMSDWKRLGLSGGLMAKRATEISGGQRQRIMLSVAGLLGKPLLLADEPTSALDEDTTLLVLDYLRMLAKERGIAILLVSHSPAVMAGCTSCVHL